MLKGILTIGGVIAVAAAMYMVMTTPGPAPSESMYLLLFGGCAIASVFKVGETK